MEIEMLLLMDLPSSVDPGRESVGSLDLGGKQLFRWGKGSSVENAMFSIRKIFPVYAGGKGKLASVSMPVKEGKNPQNSAVSLNVTHSSRKSAEHLVILLRTGQETS